jgi:hypothetical protein
MVGGHVASFKLLLADCLIVFEFLNFRNASRLTWVTPLAAGSRYSSAIPSAFSSAIPSAISWAVSVTVS